MTTRSTASSASSTSARSSSGVTGRDGPLSAPTDTSLLMATTSLSPSARAASRRARWPGWSRSKQPFVRTMRRPSARQVRRSSATSTSFEGPFTGSSGYLVGPVPLRPSHRRIEGGPAGEGPVVRGAVEPDVLHPALHSEGVEAAVIVVGRAVLAVGGHVEQVGAFRQPEVFEHQGDVGFAGEPAWRPVLEVGVGPVD